MAYIDLTSLTATLLIITCISYLIAFFRHTSIRHIPGPRLASFSNLWLMYQCRRGRRYKAVDAAHEKYGTFVRIQPHHVSIADPDAIPIIYGHGNGFLKSEYYDAFVSIQRGLFNTRDRAEHTRKRKTISHTFSAKSVGQFEPYIKDNLRILVRQWNAISSTCRDGNGYVQINALQWLNYCAFDIIGDLAFGAPFGMLEAREDRAEVMTLENGEKKYAPAIEVLNRRGEVSSTIGCWPWMKPWAKYIPDPFFNKGIKAVENLAGIAIARVNHRLENAASINRTDLLSRLMEGCDENGQPLGKAELTVEALTQLIAGSDTTSNTSTALLYHLLTRPDILHDLQSELDSVIPLSDSLPSSYDSIRSLPLLDAVIKETLRLHSTSSLGLPRTIPQTPTGKVDILGKTFESGIVVSVPSYTLHHSKKIWGEDADDFKPERWIGEMTEKMKSAFIPFSTGPRACIGRNLAEVELKMIAATIVVNFDYELYEEKLETREGFLRKPLRCMVGIKKRDRSNDQGER